MKPRYSPKKPLFFAYKPSTATKYAENAQNQKKMGLTAKFSPIFAHFSIYKPYGPESSQEFQQWGPTYDPQLAGYAHRLARYTPLWYCPWVAVDP